MIEIEVLNLAEFEELIRRSPENAAIAARRALNAGAKRLASKSSERIRGSVAFKPRELYSPTSGAGKITVQQTSATDIDSMETVVRASDRPTLLSKFARNRPSGKVPKGLKPRVVVSRGNTMTLDNSFFIRFKNGTVGIVRRLKPGERLVGTKTRGYRLSKNDPNAFVLYSVEVDQALATAAPDEIPEVAEFVRNEFLRQFALLEKS